MTGAALNIRRDDMMIVDPSGPQIDHWNAMLQRLHQQMSS
jgi:hypothetical protein